MTEVIEYFEEKVHMPKIFSLSSFQRYLHVFMLSVILFFAASMPHLEIVENVIYQGLIFRKKVHYACEIQMTCNTCLLKMAVFASIFAVLDLESKFFEFVARGPWILAFTHFFVSNTLRWFRFLESGFRLEADNVQSMTFALGLAFIIQFYITSEIFLVKFFQDLVDLVFGYFNENLIDDDFAFEICLDDIKDLDLPNNYRFNDPDPQDNRIEFLNDYPIPSDYETEQIFREDIENICNQGDHLYAGEEVADKLSETIEDQEFPVDVIREEMLGKYFEDVGAGDQENYDSDKNDYSDLESDRPVSEGGGDNFSDN